jgi:hypothetical protein
MTAADDQIEQAHAVLSNRTAAAATLRIAADQARLAIRAIDQENELAPQREAEILARMPGTSIDETLSALGRLDDDAIARCWMRKIAVALAAQLDERRLHARAQRENQLQALFARAAAE